MLKRRISSISALRPLVEDFVEDQSSYSVSSIVVPG